MVDSFLAAGFHARHLPARIRSRRRVRISRALAVEAGYLGLAGMPAADKAAAVLREAQSLAAQFRQSPATGLTLLVEGILAFLQGRWSEAVEAMGATEAFLRTRVAGVAWELATARLMECVSLVLSRRTPPAFYSPA